MVHPLPPLDFRRTPVTLVLTAVAAAIEAASLIDPALRDFFYDRLRMGILSWVWSGEYWRPFTTTLLHAGPLHAVFNVYWMLAFGRVLEPAFGSLRFLALVVFLGSASSMVQFLASNWGTPLDGQIGGVGLSGIVYGLFGVAWVGRRWRPEFHLVCDRQVVQVLVFWFLLCIALTHAGLLPVANTAHGAGLGFGALCAAATFARHRRRLWQAAALLAGVLALATIVAAPGHPLYESHHRAVRAHQTLERLPSDRHGGEPDSRR